MEYQERNKEIIRTSVVGIAANVLLACREKIQLLATSYLEDCLCL